MKKQFLTLAIWIALLIQVFPMQAQPEAEAVIEKKYTFVNNTGRATNDLHIEFEGTVSLLPDENGIHARYPNKRVVPAEGETRADFSGTGEIVPNGQHISGTFSSNAEFNIKKWWWTYNEVQVGEKQDANSAMLISRGQVVTELEFENHITEGRPGQTKPVVNDLHIVVNKKPEVINLEKEDEDDDEKAGGVFKDQEVVTCECPPEGTTYQERTNRNREVRNMPEPCRSICRDKYETCYVVHLRNPENKLEPDSIVSVRLRSNDDIEVSNWWWTEDGKPLYDFRTLSNGRKRVSRGNPNAPPPNNDNPGGVMRGPRIVDFSKASLSGLETDRETGFILPDKGTSQPVFSIGISAGYVPGSAISADGSLFPGQESLNEQFLNDNGSWMEIMEMLCGEFFFGELNSTRPNEEIYIDRTMDWGFSVGAQLTPSWEMHAAVSRASIHLSMEMPLTVFPFTGEEYRVEPAILSATVNQTRFMAGTMYILPTGLISPIAGGGLAVSVQHATPATLTIRALHMDAPMEKSFSRNLHAYAFGGITARISPSISADIRFQLMAQWGDNQNLVDMTRPYLSGTVRYFIQP